MDLQLQMEPNVMVVRTFNSSTQEVEAEASRPLCVGGQPDLIYTVSCRPAIMAASGRHGGKNRRSCLQTQRGAERTNWKQIRVLISKPLPGDVLLPAKLHHLNFPK